MNSRHLSILPDDSARKSTADTNPAGAVEGANYRARYQAFLNQQSQRGQRRARPNAVAGFAWGVINFAIFVALFLAILTLFGFGLSRLGGNVGAVNGNVSATGSKSATLTDATPSPARKKQTGKR
ncbi:MAG: hypothetical protein ABI977_11705 [Acidobacteriota bacterium]